LEFFTSGSSQEVRYRASLRGASFLGQSPEERIAVYDDLLKSYDARSDISHGNVYSFSKKKRQQFDRELPSISRKTRSYLRRSLLNILDLGDQFDPAEMERNLLKK
jgi:hypothetical protein